MRFFFQVEVEVERDTGKFAAREDIEAELQSQLDNAIESELYMDESTYSVVEVAVNYDTAAEEAAKAAAKRARRERRKARSE